MCHYYHNFAKTGRYVSKEENGEVMFHILEK